VTLFVLPGVFLLGFALGGAWGFTMAFDMLNRRKP
jgi:hypothetical protein